MCGSNDEYQQYGFSQELINLDPKIEAIDTQLTKTIEEIKTLVNLSQELKQHQSMYKHVWKKHNLEKFSELLIKSKALDNLLGENF